MANSSFSWERLSNQIQSHTRIRNRRRNDVDDEETNEDMSVFGYQCKLYRDDDKYRWIQSGKHLIPWMGRDELRIDRYDARGYLNDINQYVSNKNDSKNLNSEEIEFEAQLNLERFKDLSYDEVEQEVKDNEQAKYQYSNVQYQYDQTENKCKPVDDNKHEQIVKDGFKVPIGLFIPDNIIKPKSNKLHFIIEKTASFVAQQGSQMEILLKTKQACNSNFQFLSIDSELHQYYKHVLNEIKSGKYIPKDDNGSMENDSDSDDGNYLHPSLLASGNDSNKSQMNITNLFASKQNDGSYSQLVKNFKDKFGEDLVQDSVVEEKSSDSNTSQTATDNKTSVSSLIPQPPPEVEPIILKLAQHVAKNGIEFEGSIKSLNDKKFDFLNPGHVYHAYYVKQKISFINETKSKTKKINGKKDEPIKPIAFSISAKEAPKKLCPSTSSIIESELESKVSQRSSIDEDDDKSDKEDNPINKEKQLQEERRKKAMEFLKILRQENRLNDSIEVTTYGPNLPKPKETIRLSPTNEEITSPTHSPSYSVHDDDDNDDIRILPPENKKESLHNRVLLPFTSKDDHFKERSLSISPNERHIAHSRYDRNIRRDREEESNRNRKKSSKRHRHRSRSRSKSRSRHRSKERDHSRRSHKSKHRRHRRRRSSSTSRSGRSSHSTSPPSSNRHRHRSHTSKSRRSRSNSS